LPREIRVRILIVEDEVRRHTASEELPPVDERETITIEQRESIGFSLIFRAMFAIYPKRTLPGLVLTPTEAFLYNAVLFSYGLVLTSYYGVSSGNVAVIATITSTAM